MRLPAFLVAITIAAAATFAGLWTSAPAAHACTCRAETVEDLADESLLIATGVITGTRGSGPDTWYELGIRTTWKGQARLAVEFQPGSQCGAMDLSTGTDATFFLRGVEGGPYYAYTCGFSGSEDEVLDELKALGYQGQVLSPPVAQGSTSASAGAPPVTTETPSAGATPDESEEDPTAVPVWVYAPLAFGVLITVVLVGLFSRPRRRQER